MKKKRVSQRADRDTMRPHYDFRGGVRGKYVSRYRAGTNVVVLDPAKLELCLLLDWLCVATERGLARASIARRAASGRGFTSVAGETAPLEEGQQVRWPRGIPHRLWTEDSTMSTLMV